MRQSFLFAKSRQLQRNKESINEDPTFGGGPEAAVSVEVAPLALHVGHQQVMLGQEADGAPFGWPPGGRVRQQLPQPLWAHIRRRCPAPKLLRRSSSPAIQTFRFSGFCILPIPYHQVCGAKLQQQAVYTCAGCLGSPPLMPG